MSSVALPRHFLFLRVKEGHTSGCANFITAGKANSISKTGKKAEGFRSKWAMMDAKCVHPRLTLPMEMPQSDKGWSFAKLTDERETLVLEQMKTDLKPAPLQARTRPLWELGDEEDKVRLSLKALSDGELAAVLRLLVGDDQEYPPSIFTPLFHREDGAQVVASRPTFDGRGLVPPAPIGALAAPKLVELSSDESHGEEEGEEEDSEVTPEGMGETSPLSKADILRAFPDDDEADARQEEGELPIIPTRGRSSLVSRGVTPVSTPSEAASGPSAAPFSPPGVCAPTPQASKLSGFKLTKRRVDYTAVGQPPPSAKKRKEDAVPTLGTEPSAAAAPPSVEKGNVSSQMTQLWEDLLGADPRLVAGCLELASGWLQSDAAVRATLSQATTTSEKEKRAAAEAVADREAALKDAKAAHDRCQALEDELKSLRDEHAEEARGRQAKEEEMRAREDAIKNRDAELGELAKAQATERSRLEELERKVEAKGVDLDAKAKVLAEDRTAFALLEKRSRVALKALYEKGLEKPLTTNEDGPAQLLPCLVAALEEVVSGIGPMAEAEARVLSIAALTRVFSHLHLRDPTARLDELLEPVDEERCAAAAAAVKGQRLARDPRPRSRSTPPQRQVARRRDDSPPGPLLELPPSALAPPPRCAYHGSASPADSGSGYAGRRGPGPASAPRHLGSRPGAPHPQPAHAPVACATRACLRPRLPSARPPQAGSGSPPHPQPARASASLAASWLPASQHYADSASAPCARPGPAPAPPAGSRPRSRPRLAASLLGRPATARLLAGSPLPVGVRLRTRLPPRAGSACSPPRASGSSPQAPPRPALHSTPARASASCVHAVSGRLETKKEKSTVGC
nr:actin cytoskeleton-regulatory complex protein PAN1-like [Aegilops tauschii subsp. strangulata]